MVFTLRVIRLHREAAMLQVDDAAFDDNEAHLVLLTGILEPVEALAEVGILVLKLGENGHLGLLGHVLIVILEINAQTLKLCLFSTHHSLFLLNYHRNTTILVPRRRQRIILLRSPNLLLRAQSLAPIINIPALLLLQPAVRAIAALPATGRPLLISGLFL